MRYVCLKFLLFYRQTHALWVQIRSSLNTKKKHPEGCFFYGSERGITPLTLRSLRQSALPTGIRPSAFAL